MEPFVLAPIVGLASETSVGFEAVPLGRRSIVAEACYVARRQSERPGTPLTVWVDLPWPDAERVDAALRRTGLPADQLVVQLAEAGLHRRGVYAGLMELDDLGVQLAVRRSATADPQMRTLRSLPIDILRFGASDPAPSLVERGHDLGLVMHADEVDDEATAERLLARDCDLAQGRLFANATARRLVSNIAR
jgi:EAL domain-containing protein (putative c-di-GMP-specific phosphodiesterase class I)